MWFYVVTLVGVVTYGFFRSGGTRRDRSTSPPCANRYSDQSPLVQKFGKLEIDDGSDGVSGLTSNFKDLSIGWASENRKNYFKKSRKRSDEFGEMDNGVQPRGRGQWLKKRERDFCRRKEELEYWETTRKIAELEIEDRIDRCKFSVGQLASSLSRLSIQKLTRGLWRGTARKTSGIEDDFSRLNISDSYTDFRKRSRKKPSRDEQEVDELCSKFGGMRIGDRLWSSPVIDGLSSRIAELKLGRSYDGDCGSDCASELADRFSQMRMDSPRGYGRFAR